MRILIHLVDDDTSFRTALARLLRAFGYDVETYRSAGEFLKRRPDSNTPSCIILDAEMPGLSGPELQERLAKLGCTLPIVFLTGRGDIPMSVRAIKAGAEDFLTKPVSKDALIDAIGRAMGTYSAGRERDAHLRHLRSRVGTLTPRENDCSSLALHRCSSALWGPWIHRCRMVRSIWWDWPARKAPSFVSNAISSVFSTC